MRLITFFCIPLFAATCSTLLAQNSLAPPGFIPGQPDDALVAPAPDPALYTGHAEEDATTYGYPGTISKRPSRRAIRSADPNARTFRIPSAAVVFPEEEPPMPRIWFRAEALYWWSKQNSVPIPVATLGDPADAKPGALDQPGTAVLLGDQTLGPPGRGGGRFTFGFSFDAAQAWGFEATYFSLASATVGQGVFSDGSSGSALLAFPFFNPTLPGEDSSPIALPGSFAGNALLTSKSFLQGADFNLLHNVVNTVGVRLDLLGGFRYANLQEDLNFSTDSPNVYPNPPAFFRTFDQFNTNNNFYGGQFGVRASYDASLFFMNATTKLAVGSTVENVTVNGGTFTNANGGFQSAPGAYLSQPSNMGSTTRDQFAVMPELNMNFGLRLRPWASVIVGYSFLYISSVARPGDQLDHVINPTQAAAITNNFPSTLSGTARPGLSVHNTDFWAQGLNFALEFRF